jgi:hypothetical protein
MRTFLTRGLLAAAFLGLAACGSTRVDRNDFRHYVHTVKRDIISREPDVVERYSEPEETTKFDFNYGSELVRRVRIVRDEHGTTVIIGSYEAGAASIRNGACVELPNKLYNGGCPHLSAEEARDIFEQVLAFDRAQAEKT